MNTTLHAIFIKVFLHYLYTDEIMITIYRNRHSIFGTVPDLAKAIAKLEG